MLTLRLCRQARLTSRSISWINSSSRNLVGVENRRYQSTSTKPEVSTVKNVAKKGSYVSPSESRAAWLRKRQQPAFDVAKMKDLVIFTQFLQLLVTVKFVILMDSLYSLFVRITRQWIIDHSVPHWFTVFGIRPINSVYLEILDELVL